MTTTIHRQIGKLGKRSADEATVAMLIKEVNDAEILLGKLIAHTKAWRNSWADILVNQTILTDSFHDIYKAIPLPQDYNIQVAETPVPVLRKVAKLHATQNDLKTDIMEELDRVDKMLLERLSEAKAALKPIKKAIDKRENKKLDFERFTKVVNNQKGKKTKTERDYSVLSKAEMDLERAQNAYENADNHLKGWVPEMMAKITEFLPCIVESIVQTQYTLLSNTYSAIYEYANEHNFTDPDGEVVIAEWEELFLSVQQQVESEISSIARGKAITMPMSQLVQEKSHVPSIPRIGRGKKPPPPPPPAGAPAAATPEEKSRFGKMMPSRFSRDKEEPAPSPPSPPGSRSSRPSIGSTRKFSSYHEREESPPRFSSRPTIGGTRKTSGGRDGGTSPPPPPVSRARPTIGGVKSRVPNSNLSASRDESPPPPLPGPRPGQPGSRQNSAGEVQQHDFRSVIKSRSATPLAGIAQNSLAPSQRSDLVRIRSAGSSDGRQPEERLLGAVSPSAIRAAERSLSTGASDHQNSRPVIPRSPTASISSYRTAVSDAGSLSSIAGKKKPPPPPPPKKKGLGKNETWVRALFPFEGQDTGDLAFKEGDKIKVLKKTESTDDWWEGEVHGRKGQFPANYTEIITS
ncbi:hypothetical protein L873DRAFT_1663772 [Choiromyces venosus 120613-1]|uniref:SH3 domain-containing protein n=1 Tax=Choiromyces venosus 120613-1 TaxID=1336337 RepID=A0A3N4KHB7_9PEZI|nr:hypothetical protein L873DRAFT_1663772 [Choiromyces venosus 120613-1]